jgi:hypothetical protein
MVVSSAPAYDGPDAGVLRVRTGTLIPRTLRWETHVWMRVLWVLATP